MASSETSETKDGNPTAFMACSISVQLRKSMIPTLCQGPTRPFSELGEKWKSKILVRAGIFNGGQEDVSDVCSHHENLLGKGFSAKYGLSRKVCLWVNHPTPKPGKKRRATATNPDMKFFVMTRERSQLLLERHQLLFPTDGVFVLPVPRKFT